MFRRVECTQRKNLPAASRKIYRFYYDVFQVGHTSSEMDQDISQRQLELQYSRVVQAAFLYSRVRLSILISYRGKLKLPPSCKRFCA